MLATVTFVTGALLTLGLTAAWITTTQMLHQSVEQLVEESERNTELGGVEAALLRFNRLSSLLATQPDPSVRAQRRDAFVAMHVHLDEAVELSSSPRDRAEVDALGAQVDDYISERLRLERSGASLETVARETRAVLNAPLASLARLRAHYRRALRESQQRANTLADRAMIAGTVAIVFVFVGLAALLLAVREWIILPLGRIVRALDELREKGPPAQAPIEGPAEICRIAEVLNGTTRELADRRRQQLAFMAGVAHDLRNPLAGLRITIDLLRELEPGLEARIDGRRALAILDRNIARITQMVGDLLDATRIEAGDLSLSIEQRHDLRDSARAAVELYRGTSERHTLKLIVPDAPVLVRADPARLDQVVGNLVSNAIKYAPDGGDVIVRAEQVDGYGVLSVRDRGVGIAPEEQQAIFEPFKRAASAPSTATGAGLGLSVARRIVEAHGGRIELESAKGKGSEFRVLLPASPAAA